MRSYSPSPVAVVLVATVVCWVILIMLVYGIVRGIEWVLAEPIGL